MILNKYLFHIFKSSSLYFKVILILLVPCSLSSCFTGIEGTKKISLTRTEKKSIAPTPEDKFFNPVAGESLENWEIGRPFIAADNRSILAFEQEGLPLDMDSVAIGGKTLYYNGMQPRLAPDGSEVAILFFSDGNNTFRLNSGKEYALAPQLVTSDNLPMLIDKKMIDSARSLLLGMRLWTRTPLWYDPYGNRVGGKKYVPVQIDDVQPGNVAFPIKVLFHDDNGVSAWAMMNFGTSGMESRSFANVFMLSDLRKKFPAITDENWNLICAGKVRLGMTKEECKLSLGNPKEVDSGRDYTSTLDLWNYADGTVLWFQDGILTRMRL